MALSHNNSVGTDNLVMCYDSANTKKSWLGQPTTNYIPFPAASYNGVSFVNFGYNYANLGVTYTYGAGVSNPINVIGVLRYFTGTTGYKYFSIDSTTLPTTGTYTFSYYARMVGGTAPNNIGNSQLWRAAGSDRSVTGDWNPSFTTEWVRYSTSGPAEAGTILQYFPVHSGAITGGFTIEYCGFQLELGSYATPYVEGGRSTTGSVLDYVGQNPLTPSNLVYASNNTFSFSESSSSTITTTLPVASLLPALSSFTLEAWVRVTAWPTNTFLNPYGQRDKAGTIVGACYYSGTGIRWAGNALGTGMTVFGFVRGEDAYRNTATYTVPSLNVYNHFVFTNNSPGGGMSLYVNGELFSTVAAATQQYAPGLVSGIGNLAINRADIDGGGTSVYSYLNGNIDAVKVYQRALSANEVRNNFIALKGRFGL